MISKRHHLLTVINHLLEDVAEKPARLTRAMELAKEAVDEAFIKKPYKYTPGVRRPLNVSPETHAARECSSRKKK